MKLLKKIITLAVILLFFSVSVIPSTGTIDVKQISVPASSGNMLYVGGSGPNNYTKIQDAIDDAVDGDTVFVYGGNYKERLVIDKSINLIGESRDTTVIGPVDTVVYINVDYVKVTGFTIRGGIGIWIYGGKYSNISGNYINIDIRGVDIESSGSSSCVISRNIITTQFGPGNAIQLLSGDNNVISDNTIIVPHSPWPYTIDGIDVYRSCYNKIINNTIQDGYIGIDINTPHNIVMNNTINSSIYGIDAGNSIISGNIIQNTDVGITIGTISRNNIISGNSIMNCGRGVEILFFSTLNKITNNNFINNNLSAIFGWFCFFNRWDGNYWDEPKSSPHLIYGRISIWSIFGIIPWFEIDWHPAQEPYDIGGV